MGFSLGIACLKDYIFYLNLSDNYRTKNIAGSGRALKKIRHFSEETEENRVCAKNNNKTESLVIVGEHCERGERSDDWMIAHNPRQERAKGREWREG